MKESIAAKQCRKRAFTLEFDAYTKELHQMINYIWFPTANSPDSIFDITMAYFGSAGVNKKIRYLLGAGLLTGFAVTLSAAFTASLMF